jgi:hypothetical protein
MIIFALIVFAIAAAGGLALAWHVLFDELAPWTLSLGHALLGAIGLIVLLILLLLQDSVMSLVLTAFIVLLLAALGGFFLASFHMRKKIPRKAIVFAHAGAAVVGFLILIGAAL